MILAPELLKPDSVTRSTATPGARPSIARLLARTCPKRTSPTTMEDRYSNRIHHEGIRHQHLPRSRPRRARYHGRGPRLRAWRALASRVQALCRCRMGIIASPAARPGFGGDAHG